LKSFIFSECNYHYRVAPFAGVWIEIDCIKYIKSVAVAVAPFAGVWIEIL